MNHRTAPHHTTPHHTAPSHPPVRASPCKSVIYIMRSPTYLLVILCLQALMKSLSFTSTVSPPSMKSLSFTSTVSPPSPLSRASGVQKPTLLCAEKKKKNVVKLDEAVKAKLLAESIAPWRTVRLFLYGSFGSGAFVGGFLTNFALPLE